MSTHLPIFSINTLSASSVSPFSQSKSVNSTTLQQQFWTKIFSYSAPRIWNGLLLAVRQSPSLDSFKRNLKTYYFAIANSWPPILPPAPLIRHALSNVDAARYTNCYVWPMYVAYVSGGKKCYDFSKNQLAKFHVFLRETVSSPSGVGGGAPAEIDFWCILALKSSIWWQKF